MDGKQAVKDPWLQETLNNMCVCVCVFLSSDEICGSYKSTFKRQARSV